MDEKKDDDTETGIDKAKSQTPSNINEEEKNPKKEETQTVLESPHTPDGEKRVGIF